MNAERLEEIANKVVEAEMKFKEKEIGFKKMESMIMDLIVEEKISLADMVEIDEYIMSNLKNKIV